MEEDELDDYDEDKVEEGKDLIQRGKADLLPEEAKYFQ